MSPYSFRRRAAAALPRAGRRLACLAAPLLLVACAGLTTATSSPVQASAAAALFDDAHFAAAAEPIDPRDVLRLSPQMQDYVDRQILPAARRVGARQALIDGLYAHGKLRLDYEATMTRDAAQAFEARTGNCMSLVLMTGAFAKAMGMDVTFQQVSTDEFWSRAGDMYFMSGHVNLQLRRTQAEERSSYDRYSIYTVDFLPQEDTGHLHVHAITEARILSMYMNNRAAEAMVGGQLDDAYWRARQAIVLDPDYLSAYNTLAVIYLKRADAPRAERALRFALERSPDNPRIVANYAQTLRTLGRAGEAQGYEARLAALEPYPPFYFFNQGQAAFKAGDLRQARDLFVKELDRAPDYHEFHYWLAITEFALGDVDKARRELAVALDDAVQRTDHDLYAAKLDRLKSYRSALTVQ